MATPLSASALGKPNKDGFVFSNLWFDFTARNVWEKLIPEVAPVRILEVGSYEGASACYLIAKLAGDTDIEIHCIDTWEGGVEQDAVGVDMNSVELRFQHNIKLAMDGARRKVDLHVHKGPSDLCLSRLLSENKRNHFDFVYIDGSHQAPDVLCDAVLGFRLLRIGGVMAFDDYLWAENLPGGRDPLRCPKPAIDAFTNLYFRKLQILPKPLYQLYVKKVAD
jgi:predicted O-methyltransferase YrrM